MLTMHMRCFCRTRSGAIPDHRSHSDPVLHPCSLRDPVRWRCQPCCRRHEQEPVTQAALGIITSPGLCREDITGDAA